MKTLNMRISGKTRCLIATALLLAVCPLTAAQAALQIGDRMKNGTVYAGVSPQTGKPMYTTPADAPGVYNSNAYVAQACAQNQDAHGHQDWRVPSQDELNVLYQNNSVIGGFNNSGSLPAGWYRSSTPGNNDTAWGQRFSDGRQQDYYQGLGSSLRCVR